MEPEQCEYFTCPACAEQVPEQNRTLHTLACQRRQKRRTETETEMNSNSKPSQSEETEDGVIYTPDRKPDTDIPVTDVHHGQVSTLPFTTMTTPPNTTTTTTNSSPPPTTTTRQPPSSIPCSFCELDFTPSEHFIHEAHCGTRTDVCAACSRRVRKRDWPLHMDSSCQFGATTTSSYHPRSESDPLLPRENPHEYQISSWPSAAVATAAVAAGVAVAFGMLAGRRRRR